MDASPSLPDRRAGACRRRRPTRMLAVLWTPGRRRGFRRTGEGHGQYVDRPSARIALWTVALLICSSVDAFLTLLHIEAGGRELIPTMELALRWGPEAFTTTKMALTALGAVLLALHENFAPARLAARVLLVAYMVLMAYHALLVALR